MEKGQPRDKLEEPRSENILAISHTAKADTLIPDQSFDEESFDPEFKTEGLTAETLKPNVRKNKQNSIQTQPTEEKNILFQKKNLEKSRKKTYWS